MYNNRRLYSPMQQAKDPESFSKLPVRICLSSAVFLALALILFIRLTGAYVLYIHYWVYVAVAAVILLLLLGAGAFGVWRRVQGERARKNVAITLIIVMVILALGAFSFCSMIASSYLKPVVFSHSPSGENSIVVMRTEAERGAQYTAYPLSGSFYLAAVASEEIYSEMGVERVEWDGENVARVYMTDLDGKEAFITVDYTKFFEVDEEGAEAQ